LAQQTQFSIISTLIITVILVVSGIGGLIVALERLFKTFGLFLGIMVALAIVSRFAIYWNSLLMRYFKLTNEKKKRLYR